MFVSSMSVSVSVSSCAVCACLGSGVDGVKGGEWLMYTVNRKKGVVREVRMFKGSMP